MNFKQKKINIKLIFLSIIMTFITVILTHVYWLSPKPIAVSFDIKNKETYSIFVELYKKNVNNYINKSNTIINKFDNNENFKGELYLKNIKNPEKLKITLSFLESNHPITIRNLKLSGDNHEVIDMENINIDYADIIYKDKSSITFKPTATEITIFYNGDLTIKNSIKFSIVNLIIIILLSYIIFYFLFNYIYKENDSKIDVIFRVLFILCLFIPMIHIDNRRFSQKENRSLATFKPFINSNYKINFEFFNDINEWYKDRFFLKQEMCDLNTKIRFYIASNLYSNSNTFINKHNNWMFSSNYSKDIKEDNKKTYYENLIKFNELCEKNNIKLYVLVMPRKEAVYNNFVNICYKENILIANEFYEWLKKSNKIKIIYPYNELKDASNKNYVYYKSDHHWTDYGVYLAYKKLVKEIKKDFPNFKESDINDFNIFENNYTRPGYERYFVTGWSLNTLNVEPTKVLDVQYKFLKHKDSKNIEFINDIEYRKRVFNYKNSKNNLKAIIIGDSTTESFSSVIAYDFKSLTKIRTNNGQIEKSKQLNIDMLEKECIIFHPDIIILNLASGDISPVISMYKNNEENTEENTDFDDLEL